MDILNQILVEEPIINLNMIGIIIEQLAEPINVLENEERRIIPKNENFYEVTMPMYMGDLFREHFRMSRAAFEELSHVVGNARPEILQSKIPLNKKLLFTIWIISKPESFLAAGDRFGISRSTAHFVFSEIVNLILTLMPEYIRWPASFNVIEENFYNRSRMPGVVGAVDGCHIEIKQPSNNANDYYNRKNYHSIILQGTCDDSMKFIDIYVGVPGRVHDARVFRNSPIFQQINALPENLHILADSAYPLSINVMTPFRNNGHLNVTEISFNTRHSSVRAVIERAFGRLKGKFRRLKYLDIFDPNFGTDIISAACILHNFIIVQDGEDDEEFLPDEGFGDDYNENEPVENREMATAKRREMAEILMQQNI